jgi:hypothetical protein
MWDETPVEEPALVTEQLAAETEVEEPEIQEQIETDAGQT